MNSAKYVSDYIEKLKAQGLALMLIAWKIALACVGWAYVFGAAGEYCNPANRRSYFKKHGADHPTIASKCQVIRSDDPLPSCDGCKWYPGGLLTRFFDCRGFVRWVLKVVFGWTLQGSGCTSQWNTESNWKAKGEIKDGMPKDTLCCVFYYKKDKKGNRTKTLEHTGFCFNGETVECSNGVQYSKTLNKKWDVWAVPACCNDAVIQPTEPQKEPEKQPEKGQQTVSYKTIRKGNYGDLVKKCQTMLQKLGYDLGICGVDGDFGQATEKAVKQFQKDHGLVVDGVVGAKTWAALEAAEPGTPEKMYTVTVTGLKKAVADKIVSEYGGTITEQKG